LSLITTKARSIGNENNLITIQKRFALKHNH